LSVLKLLFVFPFLLCTGGCREQVNLTGVEVLCKRYEGQFMRPIGSQCHHLKTMEAWRNKLDKHARELGQAARKCPSVENTPPGGLTYEYHMAWEDSSAGNVVLYYFAPIPHPKVFAGYGIQAVVGINEDRLKQVCVFPVPLE